MQPVSILEHSIDVLFQKKKKKKKKSRLVAFAIYRNQNTNSRNYTDVLKNQMWLFVKEY